MHGLTFFHNPFLRIQVLQSIPIPVQFPNHITQLLAHLMNLHRMESQHLTLIQEHFLNDLEMLHLFFDHFLDLIRPHIPSDSLAAGWPVPRPSHRIIKFSQLCKLNSISQCSQSFYNRERQRRLILPCHSTQHSPSNSESRATASRYFPRPGQWLRSR